MQEAGVELLDDLTRAAAIGPFDAVRHLRRFAQARGRLAAYLNTHKPDGVILVDFGDFNLPVIAPLAKRAGCRVLYYVSPQLWAWGRFRLRWVRRYVDRMIVLFRFEEEFYRRLGIPVTWAGHPLVEPPEQARSGRHPERGPSGQDQGPSRGIDAPGASATREQSQQALGLNPWRMTVGLLPGSRRGEIARHLPLLVSAARRIAWDMPGVQFLVPKAPSAAPQWFAPLEGRHGLDVTACENRMRDCLQAMDAAIVASGTATIEAALGEVPMVVVYRTSWPTYLAARMVVRVPHIAMVNHIAGRQVVPEYVQMRATPARIARGLVELLRSDERRNAMRQELRRVKELLGPPGAVERAAHAVLACLKK